MAKTQAQMLDELAEEISELDACVSSALQKYHHDYKALRHQHSPRTQANIINDLMVLEACARFGNRRGVNIVKKHGVRLLSFATGWLARFKKLDRAGRARFIGTQSALRFVNQLPMPGIGEASTHLFVGYVLHSAELLQSDTCVVCPADQNTVGWVHKFARPAAAPVTLPTRQPEPSRKRRVRPKARQKEAKRNGTDD